MKISAPCINASAPGLVAKIQKVYEAYFGKTDDFAQIKHSGSDIS